MVKSSEGCQGFVVDYFAYVTIRVLVEDDIVLLCRLASRAVS